jgi:hypothetical protein
VGWAYRESSEGVVALGEGAVMGGGTLSPVNSPLSSRPSEARAGTHTPQPNERARRIGPRLRGDDSYEVWGRQERRRQRITLLSGMAGTSPAMTALGFARP